MKRTILTGAALLACALIAEAQMGMDLSSPTDLQQYQNDQTTPILEGGQVNQTAAVFLRGKVYHNPTKAPTTVYRLDIEVRPVGTAFSGMPTHWAEWTVASVSGTWSGATISGLSPGVSYHWQARNRSSCGCISAWVPFGLLAEPATDFLVGNLPPAAPSSLVQYRLDGSTPLATGGTTTDYGIILKARVGDPECDKVHLMVEIQPVGTDFVNLATHMGMFAVSGGIAEVLVTGVGVGSYHWQAIAMDAPGAVSSWVSFGGNGEADADFIIGTPPATNTPDAPTLLGQFELNGTPIVPEQSGQPAPTHYELAVVLRGTVSDPDGGLVRLRVEVVPMGSGFTGAPTHMSDFVTSGSEAVIAITSGLLGATSYEWRAWTQDANGLESGTVSFGGNSEGLHRDFRVNTMANVAPDDPTSLGQYVSGGAAIPVGGSASGDIALQAIVSDLNGNHIRLEVEVRPAGMAFTGVPTAETALLSSGATASLTPPLATGSYHWRVRAVDSNGVASAWRSFGGNVDGLVDFLIAAATGGGGSSRGCGASEAAGSPLALVALGLALAWLGRRK